ncbi:MAG: tyrosine-type recombinase/integrase [Actinobacteria bacterium]|uniref:Unannotated protein n=1 Tax=freshwater metagenome TaxID=449393 RepID=A0A6J6F0G3_9ZZZZ|nr:tyrosine-type recombinase/integrase [Actinomycetota bacterium]
MSREKNPFDNPVRISRQRNRLVIRYYPSGLITDPNDRVKLPGSWRADDPHEAAECKRIADELRARLYAHRAAHGCSVGVPSDVSVTLRNAVSAFITSLQDDVATGTLKAHQSKLKVLIVDHHGDVPITELHTIADEIIARADAPKPDGRPKAVNTRDGYRGSLAVFGTWLTKTHSVPDPFAGRVPPVVTRKERKATARAKVHRANPFARGEDIAVSKDEIPTMEQVIALRDAVLRRETSRPPTSPTSGRGSGGGAKPLEKEAAAQLAESVTAAAATGCREAEVLAMHTSRIDLATGRIVVDRQVDRYSPWDRGAEPYLVPPKHDRERTTLVWPSYLPRLAELCEHADEHNDGWLFVPTRKQRYWCKGFEDVIGRAKELLEWEHQEWVSQGRVGNEPLRFPFTFHALRHFYASHSLTPAPAGGLGWSLGLVQRCLGHSDVRTTQSVYRHVTDLEFIHAVSTPHTWPGL